MAAKMFDASQPREYDTNWPRSRSTNRNSTTAADVAVIVIWLLGYINLLGTAFMMDKLRASQTAIGRNKCGASLRTLVRGHFWLCISNTIPLLTVIMGINRPSLRVGPDVVLLHVLLIYPHAMLAILFLGIAESRARWLLSGITRIAFWIPLALGDHIYPLFVSIRPARVYRNRCFLDIIILTCGIAQFAMFADPTYVASLRFRGVQIALKVCAHSLSTIVAFAWWTGWRSRFFRKERFVCAHGALALLHIFLVYGPFLAAVSPDVVVADAHVGMYLMLAPLSQSPSPEDALPLQRIQSTLSAIFRVVWPILRIVGIVLIAVMLLKLVST